MTMMTRKSLHIACMLLFALLPLKMVAGTDYACRDAKPIEDGAEINIPAAGEYWYKAGTYDLPIKVHFIPNIPQLAIKPEAIVYFSCYTDNEGNFVYDDPLLDSVINVASEMGKELPYQLTFDVQRDTIEGVPYLVYDLNIPRKYRDQIAAMGLTYEVDAYVKVKVETGGNAAITPDPTTRDCHKTCQDLEELPKTLNISSNDTETAYIMPFSVWKKDSIRFIWTGAEDATLWFSADDCGFEPEEGGAYVLGEMQLEIPAGGMLKMTQQEVSNLVDMLKNGGVYYTKVISGAPGELTIEYVPEQAPAEGAKMLTYGTAVEIKPGDETLYYYHDKWGATRFETNNGATVQMFVGNETVGKKKGEYNKAYTYDLSREQGIRYLELSDYEMKALDYSKEQNYIYVRFETTEPVMVTPSKWTPESDCANKSLLIHMGDTLDIPRNDAGKTIYRLRYDEWKNGDMTITRTKGTGTLKMYVGDTCAFTLGPTNKALKYGEDGDQYRYLELGPNANRTWDAETLDQWDEYEDKRATDGYYYVRFNVNNVSAVSFTRKERPIQSITITSTDGRKTLDRENPSLTLGATILPERAKDYPITWQVISGSELIDWDESALTMTAKMNMNGGEVAVVAADATNDQTADTIHIQVAAIPVLVESISLTVDKSELNEEDKVATYSIEVLPADAKDQRVKIVIVEGEDLIFHRENNHTITMIENTAGGTVRVAAIARDASAVSSDTISITIPNTLLVSEVKIQGASTLNRAHPTETYSVDILPENARNRDYHWEVVRGDSLVEYAIEDGLLTMTARIAMEGGEVWIAATAEDGSEEADTLHVQVAAIPILVEELHIHSTQSHLTEEEPSAQLSVTVLPNDAADRTYHYVVLEGSNLITLDTDAEQVTMTTGTPGGTVRIYAEANDETALHSDTLTITVANTQPVTEIHITGETLLNRETPTATYTAEVLPENALNRAITWAVIRGDSLIEWNETEHRLTLVMNMDGGEVLLCASAIDGSEVADTLTIHIAAVPVLSEDILLSTLEGTNELQDTLHLVARVLPEEAKIQTVTWSVAEGEDLVKLQHDTLILIPGHMADSVIVSAITDDESAIERRMTIYTRAVTAELETIVADIWEQVFQLDDERDSLHLTVRYEPANPISRDIRIEVTEGKHRIAPIERYDIGQGYVLRRARGADTGDAVVRISSYQDALLYGEITLHIVASSLEGLDEAEANTERRIIMLDGNIYVEIGTDAGYRRYTLLGERVE